VGTMDKALTIGKGSGNMVYKAKWYDNESWLKMMYIDKGAKQSEIAVYAGCSEETVRKLLIKYGLKKDR
jgi:DNA-binding protein Fis